MADHGICGTLDEVEESLNSLVAPGNHLTKRYMILEVLGRGTSGLVCKCLDEDTGNFVAVKIVVNDGQAGYIHARHEVYILEELCRSDVDDDHHIVRVKGHFYFLEHLCIVTELLGPSLNDLIESGGKSGFRLPLVRRYGYGPGVADGRCAIQLLRGLAFLGSQCILHCDLKPANILTTHPSQTEIKIRIIDFGLSCFENDAEEGKCLQTLSYRSPEIILGMPYGRAIDMWSLGCIVAELYTGRHLFPGENQQDQLARIMEVLGPPPESLISKSPRKIVYFNRNLRPKRVVGSDGKGKRYGRKTLKQVLECGDEAFVNFIGACLCWNPDLRMTPQEALLHPFINNL